MQQAPALAIANGRVWRPGEPIATALAVAGDRILAVGSDHEIKQLMGSNSQVIDARGGTIMPALNDSHVHFLMGSRSLGRLNLWQVERLDDVEARIREAASDVKDAWLIGGGWVYGAFPGGMPTIELLDRLVPDRPAYLSAYDTHTAWVNSRALAVTGWPGGETPGILKESAMHDFEKLLPQPTVDENLATLRVGMRLAAAHGIGSVQEASHGLEQVPLYGSLLERGELTMRVRLAFDMSPGHSIEELRRRLDVYEEVARARARPDWLAMGVLKIFADGVVESRTASMLAPYAGMASGEAGALGMPMWEHALLAESVRIASERGWQVEIHAIGDAAIREALDVFRACDRARRHRIEHIETPAAEEIPRFGAEGVVASMQPQHAEPTMNLTDVWAANLGPERAGRGFPWGSILRAGGRLTFGSDWPVVPIDPFLSLHVAVTRQTHAGLPAGGWLPGERLSLADAVAGWTSGAAYVEHADRAKGALREGMLADVIVLDRDLEATPVTDVISTKVVATVVGGRLVHES